MLPTTEQKVHPATVAVIILAHNEEANIAQALDSVARWAHELFVLDSSRTDRTVEIAQRYGCQVAQHAFTNFGAQNNYALDHFPVLSEWVLFLDADEWLPDVLKQEISTLIAGAPRENGFYLNRRLIWMGRWIRRGYYPSWILRLFRYGEARCEDRTVNPHLIVEGATGHLRNDMMHQDRKPVTEWIARHNRYATLEAIELLKTQAGPANQEGHREIDERVFGTQAQRKRWLRHKVWDHMPWLIRPFFYFFYRYLLTGGVLDGREAFIYHFLQALWFPMLIDVKALELRSSRL
jgi:glycosyltransferase involved in cell wall biosynthesis